jgi:hypothetical protein
MYDPPSYVWALVLIGVIGIPAITCLMLYRGAIAAGLSLRTATTVAGMAAAVLGGWLVASGLLARAGAYHQASGQAAPWFGAAVAGTLLGLLLATRSRWWPASWPPRAHRRAWPCRTPCGWWG